MNRRLSLPIDCFVVLFVISSLLGVLPSYDRSLSIPLMTAVVASGIIYFVLAYGVRSRTSAHTVGTILAALGIGFALLFISQYGYQNYPETPGILLRLGNMTTLLPHAPDYYMHPNAAATFLEGLIPLGIGLIFSSRPRWFQAVWLVGSLVMLYAVLLTFSRGSFIALGLTLLIYILTKLPVRIRYGVIALLLIGLAALLFVPLGNVPILNSGQSWLLSRFELYRNSLYVAKDYLFTGIGLGDTFGLVYSRYGLLIAVPFLSYTHNLPLAVWMGQGLIGLLAFVALVVTFYCFVWKVMHTTKSGRTFNGAWLGVTAVLIHGLFDARQYVEPWLMMTLLFALIGLTVAGGRMSLVWLFNNVADSDSRYFPRFVFAGTLVALIGFGIVFNKSLQAAWITNLGALEETHGELIPEIEPEDQQVFYTAAEQQYQAALLLDSQFVAANRRLGNLMVKTRRYEGPVPMLEIALAGEPDNVASRKGLGLAYVWTGETEKAAATLLKLNNPEAMRDELYTWGNYQQEQGLPLFEAYAWETAQFMYPDGSNLSVLMRLADDFRISGEVERASYWYQKILEYDPDFEDAQTALNALSSASEQAQS